MLAAGMSTFSTKGGLYERAQKRFGVSDGKKLFTYSFFEKHKLEALVRSLKAVGVCQVTLSAVQGLLRHCTICIKGV